MFAMGGKMNPLDKLYDFNNDDEFDSFEKAIQYQFLDDSEKNYQSDESDLRNWQDEDEE